MSDKPNVNLAMQYLAEVANTYAETLKPVVKAPFVNQVNRCFEVIKADREQLVARIEEQEAGRVEE